MSRIGRRAESILGDRLRIASPVAGGTLRSDPQRLTQALLNLLRNAAEHAQGDLPVCLRVEPETLPGASRSPTREAASCQAKSRSCSNPSEPDRRHERERALGCPSSAGSRAHGGDSGVVNRPGDGATFWIRIPWQAS